MASRLNEQYRTAFVTGASTGLGRAFTEMLLADGVCVWGTARDVGRLSELTARFPGTFTAVALELRDGAAAERTFREADTAAGGFDIVINNAAIYPSKPFEQYTIEEHQAVQRVNVDAGIVCVQAALPDMKRKGWGRIVNISSVTFYGGWALLSPYVASKAALVGLTRAWAREFGPHGITVNAIAPGAFPTDAEKIHPDPEGYTRFVLDHQALKRRGSAADIANAILFLISDQSSFITGQTLNVDGGWVMH